MLFKGISLGSLILIFLIIIVLFGTRRLRDIGTDLGAAVKSFRKGLQEIETEKSASEHK